METCPAAKLTIAAGMKKGDILRGPPSISAVCSRSMMSKPPMPEPIWTPTRSSFSEVILRPDICMASSEAAIARWIKRPIFFSSFFSMNFKGSKFLTSAAIWQAKLPASNCVMRATPLLPASRAFHTSPVVLPTPQISPRPVTTTLRPKLLATFRVLGDVIDRVLHGADFLRVFIGNFDVEGLFESHDQFDCIERICAQIVFERGARCDFALIDAQLFHDNLLNFLVHCCHIFPRLPRFCSNADARSPGSRSATFPVRPRSGSPPFRHLRVPRQKKGEFVV